MLRIFLAGAACAIAGAQASPAVAQNTQVRGFVADSSTGAPIAQVRVEWTSSGSASRSALTTYTDESGRFTTALAPGSYLVALRRVGYAPTRLERVDVRGANFTLRVRLTAIGVPVDPVVISASRSEQTQLDAPASTSVIERDAVAADLRFSPFEQIRELPGVDFAAKGLLQNTFEVRGPRGPTSGALLMLTDGRYAELPSIGFNVSYLVPVTREDIDRIEVVRGPAAALYGPGAPRGVLHIITRSPFESRGGVVSFTAGGRSVRQGTVRYAGLVHPRVAMSLSADYFQGEDWPAVDTIEIGARTTALKAGADPDTLRIGLRDPFIQRAGGEVRVDWRPGAETEVVTKSGVADAMNLIDVAGPGAVQLRDWRSWYVQSKVQHGHLVANLVFNANDAGNTYFLRTGLPLVEKSRLVSAQLQHGTQRGGVDLVYGTDIRATDPRTEGTVHGQYEDDDFLIEAGAYGQATAALGRRVQLVTALRADHHSYLRDLVLEPRVAIVYKAGRMHAMRFTYNRAYNSPPPSDLFRDMRTGALPGWPLYARRAEARPRNGFTFRRDCNGLCMRSPFVAGTADAYLPADATLLWSEMVTLLSKRGLNIADIPAPGSATVSTVLATFNQGAFDRVAPADVRDLRPLRRQLTDVLELGYKGVLQGGAAISADLYATHLRNRTVPPTAITPNVFFDKASLQQYLTQFRSSTAAAQLATTLAQIPVGTITPTQSPYGADILLVSRQGQTYTIYGVDLSAEVPLGARASAFATYSWASYDSISHVLPEVPLNLAIPENKASLMMSYGRPDAGLRSSLRARAVGPFRGVGIATVPGYAVIDLSSTARVPHTRASVSAEIQNLLDHAHREFSGGALLGRIVMLRTRLEF
ncbi:MAG TPA: TonB-dependent receptor [Gemmatimonadaceae bacterium]